MGFSSNCTRSINMGNKVQITITGQTGAGTNYQIPIRVGESVSSSNYDFHLGGSSTDFPSTKDDGGDFRFYASDQTTLQDFWVESVSGSGYNRTALIWVEVSADLGSNQDIYLYFNQGIANASNGDATFPFFDDFPGTSLDTNKWVLTNTTGGSASVSGSNVTIQAISGTSRHAQIRKNSSNYPYSALPKAMRFSADMETATPANNSGRLFGLFSDTTFGNSQSNGSAYFARGTNVPKNTFECQSGGAASATSNAGLDSFIGEIRLASSSLASQLVNGVSGGSNVTTNIPTSNIGAALIAYLSNSSGTSEGQCDWVLERKYQATEPVFNSAGAVGPIVTGSSKFLQIF